jgi:hypothetical protein
VEATPFLFETKVNILRRILETRNNGNRNEHLPCNLGLLLRSGDIPPVVRRATLLIRPFGLQQSTELGNTPRAPSNPLAQMCSNITLCVIGFWLKLSSQTRQKLSARQKMALYDPNTLAAQSHYV